MAQIELREHQKKAVNDLHNGAILVGDVGSGKTFTALAYYLEKEAPKDIYVITTAKQRDSYAWQLAAAGFGIGKTPESSLEGVIVVDSWNNIARYGDVRNAFFIFDEQRVVGSGSWVRAFTKIAKANHWILLSATPGDNWLDYIPAFLANGFYKNRSEFLREHVVFNRFSKFPKVERYLGVNKLVKLRNSILVEMPMERHTTRVTEKILVDYDEELMERVLKDRWNVYEGRPLRDVAELFVVMRKVANSDSSRIQKMKTLLDAHPKLIVFYNFNYELEALRTLITECAGPMRSESNTGSPATSKSKNTVRTNGPSSITTSEPIASSGLTSTTSRQSLKSQASNSELQQNQSSQSTGTLTKSRQDNDKFESEPSRTSTEFPIFEGMANGSPSNPSTRTNTSSPGSSEDSGGAFQIAEWNGHKHQPIPTSDRWVYLVQYQAGAEGWNCIETDAMCFFSLTYSYKNWHQAHGRIDRLNTPFSTLYYYVMLSNSVIDRAIWRSLNEKRSFNEKQFLVTHSQKK